MQTGRRKSWGGGAGSCPPSIFWPCNRRGQPHSCSAPSSQPGTTSCEMRAGCRTLTLRLDWQERAENLPGQVLVGSCSSEVRTGGCERLSGSDARSACALTRRLNRYLDPGPLQSVVSVQLGGNEREASGSRQPIGSYGRFHGQRPTSHLTPHSVTLKPGHLVGSLGRSSPWLGEEPDLFQCPTDKEVTARHNPIEDSPSFEKSALIL